MNDVNPPNILSLKPIQELLDLLKKDSPGLKNLAQNALEVFEGKSNPRSDDPVVLLQKELKNMAKVFVMNGEIDKQRQLLIGALILHCDANLSQRCFPVPN